MVSNEFFKENKHKITGLCKKYKKCKTIFLNMGEKYKDWKTSKHYSAAVYYRLSLSNNIKDIDKIIYLDCDTMVHNDLSNLYNIEIGDKYFMGFPAHEISYFVINGTRNYINSGVMLINLKLLRRINASLIFDKYFHNYGTKKFDEYLINVIFYNKISFLPFEYGIPDFEKKRKIIGSPSIFWKSLKGYSNGTEEQMISASNKTFSFFYI
jgi:lipopolysaccharide biosynthesis glycosyltransferase